MTGSAENITALDPGTPEGLSCPLVVDLDGTLVKSDLLVESFLLLLRSNPLYLLLGLAWLLRGRAFLKSEIARRVQMDVRHLPYHRPFLDYLQGEAARGRQLILATGADQRLARRIADHLSLFHAVLASDGRVNLTGPRKLKAILNICQSGFAYAGNSLADLPLCRCAREVVLVNAGGSLCRSLRAAANLSREFDDRRHRLVAFVQAMRPHQWLKNLLLFVSLLTTNTWRQPDTAAAALIAFCAFSLCASAVYLLNDLFDLQADRLHPQKRHRPFAAGDLPVVPGLLATIGLLAAAFGLAALLPVPFRWVLLVYFAATLAYSLVLKRVVIVDVITLAGLYTIRVVAGAAAIDVAPSFWLLAFSMFLFLSLALIKRYVELRGLRPGRSSTRGRDYRRVDLGIVYSMGTASGFVSVLVFALFIRSPELGDSYAHPEVLWLICPVLLYWVSRLWIKAGRREVNEDPLLFAIRDLGSRLVLAACLIMVVMAQ